jgi:hypothetical protein
MRKYLLAVAAVGLVLGALSSCKPKLKDVSGLVTDVDMEGTTRHDTVNTMRLYNGEDTLLFSMKDAQYNNGMVLKGDSADVSYIAGNGDTLRALLVHVKPRPAQVIKVTVDTTKTLKTR